jgi:hypothetical protein
MVVVGRDLILTLFFSIAREQAAIGYGSNGQQLQFNCGGSIISELFILTGACGNRKIKKYMKKISSRLKPSNSNLAFFPTLTLSHTHIIAAAHCESDREYGPPVAAKLGIIYIHDSGPNAQLIDIESFRSHPQFVSGEKYFDIALIKLVSFIRFDEFVRPACVCQQPSAWNKAIAVGYGKTQYGN